MEPRDAADDGRPGKARAARRQCGVFLGHDGSPGSHRVGGEDQGAVQLLGSEKKRAAAPLWNHQ